MGFLYKFSYETVKRKENINAVQSTTFCTKGTVTHNMLKRKKCNYINCPSKGMTCWGQSVPVSFEGLKVSSDSIWDLCWWNQQGHREQNGHTGQNVTLCRWHLQARTLACRKAYQNCITSAEQHLFYKYWKDYSKFCKSDPKNQILSNTIFQDKPQITHYNYKL